MDFLSNKVLAISNFLYMKRDFNVKENENEKWNENK